MRRVYAEDGRQTFCAWKAAVINHRVSYLTLTHPLTVLPSSPVSHKPRSHWCPQPKHRAHLHSHPQQGLEGGEEGAGGGGGGDGLSITLLLFFKTCF